MSAVIPLEQQIPAFAMPRADLIHTLQNSVFPGAKKESVELALAYCQAQRLDPLQKPVHIVPMWDKNVKAMRDVIMPGIGLYRVQAARTAEHVGTEEPQFGPTVELTLGGVTINVPEWCKVTVLRDVAGQIGRFTAFEYWIENYATASKDTQAPNTMWKKRPWGQLAKCAEAQALRKAFPELGAAPTAEEMEGKSFEVDVTPSTASDAAPPTENEFMPSAKSKATEPAPKPQVQDVDPETGEVEPPKAAPATAASDPLTPGMAKTVRSAMGRSGKTDEAYVAKFGCDVEGTSKSRINEVLEWAKAS